MKKIIPALIVMACMMPVVAQEAVRYGDSCYMFNPITPNDCMVLGTHSEYVNLTYRRHAMFREGYEYILPTETIVYGIAATLYRYRDDANDVDSAGYTVFLYTLVDDTMLVCIDSITSYSRATRFIYSASNGNEVLDSAAPCYEYFFSSPHVLNGTIFVGAISYISYATGGVGNPICSAVDKNRNQHWVHFSAGNVSTGHSNLMSGYWGGFFPIIQPERISCEASVAEVVETGEDYAVLSWGMDGDSCQLSIAPYDVPVDSGMVIDLTTDSYTATSLDSGVYYAARLLTQCSHRCHIHDDTLVWGGWGAPTLFYLGSEEPDTTGIGIQRVEQAPEMEISPNPTTGTLTVRCGAEIESVELYDMQGRVVSGQWSVAGGQCVVLDLAALPAGSYIVVVNTPQGKATRMVERR